MANNPYPGQGYPDQQQPAQGYPQQPGGYPQQGGPPQQGGAPQQGGYPQQGGPPQGGAPPPPAAPSGPKEPGAGSALAPPGGPAKLLYVGLVLMLVAFGAKQVVVNLSLNSSGGLLEKPKLTAEMGVELAQIDVALDAIDTEIEDLEADAPKPPTKAEDGKEGEAKPDDSKDMDAYLEKSKKHQEKLAKLQKDRADQDKDLEDKRKEVRKKYRPLIRDAARSEGKSTASGLGRVQTTLLLKLVLDFLKIIGAALCVLAGLGIAVDEKQSSGVKVYAAVMGGIAFFAVVAGGIASLLS